MLKNISSLALLLFLSFALVACNESTEQASKPSSEQNQQVLNTQSPLGQFLINSEKPAVIKFYAEWCSTCKSYQPTFQEVSQAMSESVDFYEIDVDSPQYKELLKQLKISRIPETVFINQERTSITKKLGNLSRPVLEKLITSQLI